MKLVAITLDKRIIYEDEVINRLFEDGLSALHLRKPLHCQRDVRDLLYHINPDFHNRIVLHDHFHLIEDFDLKGVHLNRRNPETPENKMISVSRSCHSFECLQLSPSFDYMFLSPIFNSISKPGYNQAYSHDQLIDARNLGIINEKVYALGGMDENTIPLVSEYGFGGAVVLGSLWGDFENDKDGVGVLERFHKLKDICNQQ